MIMAAYEICGMDMSVTMAVEGGEVDCTPWYPVFIVNTLKEADTLNRTLPAFAERCVATICMNDTLNQYKADRSLGMACIASALFGYKHAIAVAQYASTHDVPVKDAVVALGLMDKERAYEIFDPLTATDVKKSGALMRTSMAEDRY